MKGKKEVRKKKDEKAIQKEEKVRGENEMEEKRKERRKC